MFRPTLQGRILLSFIAVLVLGLVLDHLYARAEITRHLVAYLQAQGRIPAPGAEHLGLSAEWDLRERTLLADLHRSILRAMMAGFLLAALSAALLARRITRPIREMSAFAGRLARGEYKHRVPEAGDGEIVSLGRALNSLADNLDRAETLRRHLVADVAHELRTPLAGLRGTAEALRDGVLSPTPENLDAVVAEARRLGRLVQDLEDLTRLDADRLELHRRPTDLAALISKAVQVYEPDLKAKGIRLKTELATNLPRAVVDPDRVVQVIHNLMANAVNHTPPGGVIRVALFQEESGQRVTVANTGPGIDPADLPFIFERFYRGDRSRSRATGGSGLGLTIARKLVEAHGGRITAESRPGEETVFSFDLPR